MLSDGYVMRRLAIDLGFRYLPTVLRHCFLSKDLQTNLADTFYPIMAGYSKVLKHTKEAIVKHNSFYASDISASISLKKEDVDYLLNVTKKMRKIVRQKGSSDILKGKIMTALFMTFQSYIWIFCCSDSKAGGGFHTSARSEFFFCHKGETWQTRCACLEVSDMCYPSPEVGSG